MNENQTAASRSEQDDNNNTGDYRKKSQTHNIENDDEKKW